MHINQDLDYNEKMQNMAKTKNYLIFDLSEINKINFSEIMETSFETLRKSVDNKKSVIKWEGETPNFVQYLTTKEGEYTHKQILKILDSKEWSDIESNKNKKLP